MQHTIYLLLMCDSPARTFTSLLGTSDFLLMSSFCCSLCCKKPSSGFPMVDTFSSIKLRFQQKHHILNKTFPDNSPQCWFSLKNNSFIQINRRVLFVFNCNRKRNKIYNNPIIFSMRFP